jgi:hypothetical protein
VVSHTVLLDAGPLGLVTNPRRSRQSVACAQWLQALVRHGSRVLVPESADYEVRRELLRANKVRGLARLDALAGLLEYLPLTTAAIRQAAVFWAQARQQGRPTADDKALDGDVILAAQAIDPWGHRRGHRGNECWPSLALCPSGIVAGHY